VAVLRFFRLVRQITLDEVARYPRPGASAPSDFSFSPDGALLTYLHAPDGGLRRELYALDLASGVAGPLFGAEEAPISREEALRRERLRIRGTGVTRYEWALLAPALLVPANGALHLRAGGAWRTLPESGLAPRLAPDGSGVAFVRDGELHFLPAAGGPARRLTFDAAPGVANGLAEYAAQEEMGRTSGFWFSRDGRLLAYAQVDERHVPPFRIPHFAKGPHEAEEHRYPFAGEANARVRLGVVPAAGGATRWLDLGAAEYLARAQWAPDGRLFVQLQDRAQRTLELRAYDVATGASETLVVERAGHWTNLHHDLRFLEEGGFVWSSERSGYRHLWVHRRGGAPRPLTSGAWPVDDLLAVTATHAWFTAARPGPAERHLFRVALSGGEPERLSREPGFHSAAVARDGSAFVLLSESRTRPPRAVLHRAGARAIHEPPPVDLPPPELVTFAARDGTPLHAALYQPPPGPSAPPLVLCVYGGPRHQSVQDSWALTTDLRAQYLAGRGFLVMKVDNRGSSRRGVAFETAVSRRLGNREVDDQVDGVRWAVAEGRADGRRVGVYGWSYGGYMTLRCMALHPEIFRAGVAGAPVTEWEGYDTHYTERYMGTPAENPEGYREASAVAVAGRIRGDLLLVHGMLDENVHFRHTARMIDALQKAGVPHEVLLLPDERHMPRDRHGLLALERRVTEFLERSLAPRG